MKKTFCKLIFVFFLSCFLQSNAQEVLWGANLYISYQIGTLPIVISVSHGGNLEPNDIPDRSCNSPVFATDVNTIQTTQAINQALFDLTGCYPHIITSHLHRRKLDPNRNLQNGACGNLQGVNAWIEFHNFITQAQQTVTQQYGTQQFFVDLHGHGNPINRIELGYLLYDDELELSDQVLNSNTFLNYSSIKELALNNLNNYTHAQLLRGPFSFGTLLMNNGFSSVPSTQIPFPGLSSNYFSGGYILANHSCYSENNNINGLQMELHFSGLRDTTNNRELFALNFSNVIKDYLLTHKGIDILECNSLSLPEYKPKSIELVPNPLHKDSYNLCLNDSEMVVQITLFDSFGRMVFSANGFSDCISLAEVNSTGLHYIELKNSDNQVIHIQKLILH
ncbi:MAG: hypothetical protein ACK4RM_00125 [Flavobacterium sp.]